MQVTSLLVGEIILCIKEVNKKTRIAAYELLVSLAHTMHETNPPPFQGISDAAMGESFCHIAYACFGHVRSVMQTLSLLYQSRSRYVTTCDTLTIFPLLNFISGYSDLIGKFYRMSGHSVSEEDYLLTSKELILGLEGCPDA